jgi:putative transcriptional regulator
MARIKSSRLAREIAEMALAQRRLGIMDEATYEKIMVRLLGEKVRPAEAQK